MKGLVIDANYENAENIKIIAENLNKKLQMEIMNPRASDFYLIDTSKYDFILTSAKAVNARALISRLRPFMKVVLDKTADNITLSRHNEIMIVDRNRIIGIEVQEKNCYIQTIDDRLEITRITLTNLLDILESPFIVRCHKSYAVNVRFVKGFVRETRTRWYTKFVIDTGFDCRVTDFYMDEVMSKCVEYHGIKMSKKIGF